VDRDEQNAENPGGATQDYASGLRRSVVLAIVLLGLAGCAFDQTEVPPLPDDVLHFQKSGGGGNGGNGGGSGGGGCTRDEPDLPAFGTADGALTGTWARRLVMRTERDTRNSGDYKDSSWTVFELVTVSHAGARIREVVEVCGIAMDVIDGATTGFPDALIKSLPILYEDGTFLSGGDGTGATYSNPQPLVRLFGLTPEAATKPWEKCDSYFDPNNLAAECPLALWPEIYDMDCDGNTGVTLDMTVGTAATEQVFMVQRDVMTRTGTVNSADRIAGTIALEENNANLGSTKAMLKSNPPSRVVEGSAFVMTRLPEGAACNAVMGAVFDE
jgi:hypothetical protein